MTLTKRDLFKWLARTARPRTISISFPFPAAITYEVGCDVGATLDCTTPNCSSCKPHTNRKHGKTLAETRTYDAAVTQKTKYQRWLGEFQKAEAEKT